MKYCSRCGAQMKDEAVLCVSCGVMVEGIMINQAQTKRAPRVKTNSLEETTLIETFSFIQFSLLVLSAFFVVMSLVFYEAVRGTAVFDRYYVPNTACVVIALLIGLIAMCVSIFCLALGARQEYVKKQMIPLINKFIISVMIVICSLFELLKIFYV